MSEFLDELARSLVTPVPRRSALRMLGGALVAVAVPGALRPAPAQARPARAMGSHAVAFCDKTCSGATPFVCMCKNDRDKGPYAGCFETCGVAGSTCCCIKGSDGFNSGAVACPPGTRCGRRGESNCVSECKERCGTKCCSPGEYCAHKGRSLCCKNGEDACLVFGAAGSGQRGSGGRCCPRGQKCCANDKRASCCGPKQTCKAGRCDCPKGKQKCGVSCCDEKSEVCCGGRCCKKGEKCCGSKCCSKNEKCCGDHCCDAKDTCCGSDCCKQGEVCMKQVGRRLSSSSDARTIGPPKCCPRSRLLSRTFCCPAGTVADRANRRCCRPGNPDCCREDANELPCLPPTLCIFNQCRRP